MTDLHKAAPAFVVGVGRARDVVVPSPSWPLSFTPQLQDPKIFWGLTTGNVAGVTLRGRGVM